MKDKIILRDYKYIYSKVADKTNEDIKLIKSIGDYIFEELNRRVTNFENREIYVYRLGVFTFRKVKSEKIYTRLLVIRKAMESLEDEERKRKSIETLDIRIEKVKKLLEEWDRINEEKRAFKKKRDESISRSIQEQKQDMGGTKEQSI